MPPLFKLSGAPPLQQLRELGQCPAWLGWQLKFCSQGGPCWLLGWAHQAGHGVSFASILLGGIRNRRQKSDHAAAHVRKPHQLLQCCWLLAWIVLLHRWLVGLSYRVVYSKDPVPRNKGKAGLLGGEELAHVHGEIYVQDTAIQPGAQPALTPQSCQGADHDWAKYGQVCPASAVLQGCMCPEHPWHPAGPKESADHTCRRCMHVWTLLPACRWLAPMRRLPPGPYCLPC